MSSVFIGFHTYVSKLGRNITPIPSLIAAPPAPEDIQDGDLVFTINKGEEMSEFSAGMTALDLENRISPIDGDKAWVQLLSAALVAARDEHDTLTLALPITSWEERRGIELQLRDSWDVFSLEEKDNPARIQPSEVHIYPAITAAFYNIFLKVEDGILKKRNEQLLNGKKILYLLVGNRHTEWIVTSGLNPIHGGVCYFGISTVLQEIREYYYHAVGESLLPAEAEAALHNKDVEIEGNYVPLDKTIISGQKKLSQQLLAEVISRSMAEDADAVFIAGEGLLYVEPGTIQQMKDSFVVIDEQPEHAVIRGLDCLQLLFPGRSQ